MSVARVASSLALIAGMLLVSQAATPCLAEAEGSTALTNADVVQMLKSGFSDSAAIAVIQKAKTRFDLSSAALAELRYAGVTDSVIVAMVESAGGAPNVPAMPAPTALPPPPAPVTTPAPVTAPPPSRVVAPAPPPTPEPHALQGMPEIRKPSRPHVSFKLGGGGSYLLVGDYKDNYQSLTDNSAAHGGSYRLEAPTLGFNVTADVIFHVTRVLGIGVGAGYLKASKDNANSSGAFSEDGSLTLSAIPIRLGIHLFIPFSSRVEGFVNVSPTLYLAKARERATATSQTSSFSYDYTYDDDTSSTRPGVEGALGLKVNISSAFSFFLEAGGRYAKLSRFKGSTHSSWWDSASGSSSSDSSSTTLYAYEAYNSSSGTWLKYVGAAEGPPSGSSTAPVRNVREANVDFSGGAVRFGFAISF
jgi:hypothetical protein